jgi:hypothetical protein
LLLLPALVALALAAGCATVPGPAPFTGQGRFIDYRVRPADSAYLIAGKIYPRSVLPQYYTASGSPQAARAASWKSSRMWYGLAFLAAGLGQAGLGASLAGGPADRYRNNSGLLIMSGVAFSLAGSGLLWSARPQPGAEHMAVFNAHLQESLGLAGSPPQREDKAEKQPPLQDEEDWQGENYLTGCKGCPDRPFE